MTRFQKAYLLGVLLMSGAAVMVIELLGAKIIHPYFGVTLYVWAAMIAVTLLSLSVGYGVGGLLADRFPGPAGLFWILLASGIFILFIPIAASPFMVWTSRFELRFAVMLSGLVLFSLPLLLLGTVTPYTVKLCLEKIETTGMTTGTLYAVSTLGSLAGTLLTGFYLIPNFKIRSIFIALALILFVLAVGGFLLIKTFRRRSLALIAMTAAIYFCLIIFSVPGKAGETTVLHQTTTPYGQIKVVETRGVRALLVNGAPQSYYLIGEARYAFFKDLQYEGFVTSLLMIRPETHSVLMIGLGGGHIASFFARQGIITEIIEIDPAIIEIAKKYFHYDPRIGNIYLGDGRFQLRQLKRLSRRYDAVVVDAFASYDLPEHLLTREMFEDIKGTLTPEGVLAINIDGATQGSAARVPNAIYATLKSKFQHVRVFDVDSEKNVNNIVFLASEGSLDWNESTCRLMTCQEQKVFGAALDEKDITFEMGEGLLLTDGFNPISYWNLPVYATYRNRIISFFGEELLSEID